MPTSTSRRKTATTPRKKKPVLPNRYVAIKKSCNNLYGPYKTLEEASKKAASELTENSYYTKQDEIMVYDITPVKKYVKIANYTEIDLTKPAAKS
jgi:hypothetical protein